MTDTLTLTKRQARRFILTHQGLYPPRQGAGKEDILAFIQRVGCIQFDPLDVVGRNPDLVLQSRIAHYRPEMLEALLYKERALIDGWDKNMSIYPVEDWPYFRRNRKAARQHPRRNQEAVQEMIPLVRRALEARGPLSSIDLKHDEKTMDWPWGPARLVRAALETMYAWGELIVHHKVHTRKVYDFAARHLPEEILFAPDPHETEAAYHDWYVRRRIGGVGLLWNRAGGAWLGIRDFKSPERRAALKRLLSRSEVVEVRVAGSRPAYYLRREDEPRLRALLANDDDVPQYIAFLAPLDNVLWDRKLVQELFDFEYIWEVYKPVEERRYGYYVLPVLYGDRFVARFEPELDRERGLLTIKGWWWEPGVQPTEVMRPAIVQAFGTFLRYLDAERLEISAPGLAWLSDVN
jgi:uncharacterized protein